MLDFFLNWHDNKKGDCGLEDIHIQIFWFVCELVVIELQILLFSLNEDDPFLFGLCDKADLELVNLLSQFISQLFLVKLNEKVRECFDLLVENLDNVLAYELT